MTKRLQLLILTTALHTHSLFLHALETQSSTHTQQNAATDLFISNNQDDRLALITDEFSSYCTTTFSAPTMSLTEKNIYQRLLLSWQKKINELNVTTDKAIIERKVTVLNLFVNALKSITLKFEILCIGSNDDPEALIHSAISAQGLQSAHLSALEYLHTWLEKQWNSEHTTYLSNQEQTTIARTAIPSHALGNAISRTLWMTQAASLYKALEIDLYEECPLLADKYRIFMQNVHQSKFDHDAKTCNTLYATAQKLYEQCKDKELEFITANQSAPATIVHLFSSKILSIMQELTFAQHAQLLADTKIDIQDLFIKHHLLIQSPQFRKLKNSLSPEEQPVIDSYLASTAYYFDHATEQVSFTLLFEIKKAETLLRAQQEKYEYGWVKEWWFGRTGRTKTCATMITILDGIQKQLVHTDGLGTLLKYFTSCKWLNDGTIKNVSHDTNGDVIVDFTSQMLGKKQFVDIKTAAAFILQYVSPIILEKTMQYLSPQGKTQTSPTQDKKTDEQLIDITSKNSDLMQTFISSHPEFIDLIANELSKIAEKA
jgi:hypothetical protein